MNATLYWNKSDKRYLNKELEKVKDIDVQFLEDSSIVDPRLKLSTGSNGIQANYIFVPDLARYYYINNYTVSKGYIILECHVDVLMSYRSEILQNKVILKRNEDWENNCNLYLDDPEFHLMQYLTVQTIEFSGGFDASKQEFLLTVVGNTTGGIGE